MKIIEADHKITLKGIKNKINNIVSVSTIYRFLKTKNISYKKINNKLIFKDIEVINENRNKWRNNLDINKFRNGIHIDESSFCVGDLKRYGYSKKGKRIEFIKHSRTRERYSLLMAISKNKVEKYEIYKGSVSSENYADFLRTLDVKNRDVFQDNARIHHSKLVKEYCKDKINLIFNPPIYTRIQSNRTYIFKSENNV